MTAAKIIKIILTVIICSQVLFGIISATIYSIKHIYKNPNRSNSAAERIEHSFRFVLALERTPVLAVLIGMISLPYILAKLLIIELHMAVIALIDYIIGGRGE